MILLIIHKKKLGDFVDIGQSFAAEVVTVPTISDIIKKI